MQPSDYRRASEDRAAMIEARAEQNGGGSGGGNGSGGGGGSLSGTPAERNFILDCYDRNQVGDASLFNYLFRGKYCFVAEWERFLVWGGHYWQMDMLHRQALSDVERVCQAYQDAGVGAPRGMIRKKTPASKKRSNPEKMRCAHLLAGVQCWTVWPQLMARRSSLQRMTLTSNHIFWPRRQALSICALVNQLQANQTNIF